MKKIFLITSFLAFLFFVGTSYAQTPTLFSDSQITRTVLPKGISTPKLILLFPFTRITIQPGSFNDDIQVIISSGNWNGIKSLIPKNQSPVSSYSISFFDSTGKIVYPAKPILVESYDNYVKTTAFFYPLDKNYDIDKSNVKSFPGPLLLKIDLPLQDSGFIVAVDKVLDKMDPSLNPPLVPLPGASSQKTIPASPQNQGLTLLKNILPTILIVLFALAIIAYFFYQNKDKSKPRKKPEEPTSKIIVGGK
jgi:hypothetical protein